MQINIKENNQIWILGITKGIDMILYCINIYYFILLYIRNNLFLNLSLMGITATAVGCLVGGALIGGGAIAVGHKVRQMRREEIEYRNMMDYKKRLEDANLNKRRVNRLYIKYY